MNKPTYNELVDFISRLSKVDCSRKHPRNCIGCILFQSGLCKEAEELTNRLKENK